MTALEKSVLDKGYVKLIDFMGDDMSPLESARLSSQANPNPKRDDGLREYLWEHEHTSCFQSMVLHLELKLPLFVLHQFHRHRTVGFDGLTVESSEEHFRRWFSPNEQSGRYSQFEDEFYVPEKILKQDTKNKQGSVEGLSKEVQDELISSLLQQNESAYKLYSHYLSLGATKEQARLLLHNNIYTKRRIVGDVVNWSHLLKLRLDPHAQPETVAYAQAIAEIVKYIWPKWWDLFEEHTLYSVKFSWSEMKAIREILSCGLLKSEELEEMLLSWDAKRKDKLIKKLFGNEG